MAIDMAAYMKARREKRRAKLRWLLGGKCEQCGAEDAELDFDHIDPSTKLSVISSPAYLDGPWQRLLKEASKCQLLCHATCHVEKTRSERQGEHGEGKTGRRNCWCAVCAPLKREAQKEYTARHRAKKAGYGARRTERVCGERRTYIRGCRCSLCTEANTAYKRKYLSRRATDAELNSFGP